MAGIFNGMGTGTALASRGRAWAVGAALTMGLAVLTGCQQGGGLSGLLGQDANKPLLSAPATKRPLTASVNGEKIGDGPHRIALLLPLSASGGAGKIAKQMANYAKLGMRDFGAEKLQLVIKDTKGQPAGATQAANEARDEGATLVLGPLFSGNVSAASAVTIPAGIPMVSFSSDTARARTGVYLLSFAPDMDIERTASYGIAAGGTRVVALLPDSRYGAVAERTLRSVYSRARGEVVGVARYKSDGSDLKAAIETMQPMLANANAIYVPASGKIAAFALATLKGKGVDLSGKTVMGSGQWDGGKADARLVNAIYASPDKAKFAPFEQRYMQVYGDKPSITAALAYDAIALASELAKRNPTAPFSDRTLQSGSGFFGSTGLFRFLSNGRLERGLVVNKVGADGAQVVSAAPTSFAR